MSCCDVVTPTVKLGSLQTNCLRVRQQIEAGNDSQRVYHL